MARTLNLNQIKCTVINAKIILKFKSPNRVIFYLCTNLIELDDEVSSFAVCNDKIIITEDAFVQNTVSDSDTIVVNQTKSSLPPRYLDSINIL